MFLVVDLDFFRQDSVTLSHARLKIIFIVQRTEYQPAWRYLGGPLFVGCWVNFVRVFCQRVSQSVCLSDTPHTRSSLVTSLRSWTMQTRVLPAFWNSDWFIHLHNNLICMFQDTSNGVLTNSTEAASAVRKFDSTRWLSIPHATWVYRQ